MPNWCNNSVEITHDDPAKLQEFVDAFCSGNLASHYIPEPDWPNTPNEKGKLPTRREDEAFGIRPDALEWYEFDGRQDMRWRDWRHENWGCKWDFGGSEYDREGAEEFLKNGGKIAYVSFDTPWQPPTPFFEHLESLGFEFELDWYEPDAAGQGVIKSKAYAK